MKTTLNEFIQQEIVRLKAFEEWYIAISILNPKEFPLSFTEDNSGMWCEALDSYTTGCPVESFVKLNEEDSKIFVHELEKDVVVHNKLLKAMESYKTKLD